MGSYGRYWRGEIERTNNINHWSSWEIVFKVINECLINQLILILLIGSKFLKNMSYSTNIVKESYFLSLLLIANVSSTTSLGLLEFPVISFPNICYRSLSHWAYFIIITSLYTASKSLGFKRKRTSSEAWLLILLGINVYF